MAANPRVISVADRVDRREILRRVGRRLAVFLDMHYWIDLAESNAPEAQATLLLLRACVKAGRIFCPVSAPLIWELQKQEVDSQLRIAELMDELSLRLALAHKAEVFDLELAEFVQQPEGPFSGDLVRDALFVPVIWYLSSHGELTFPAEAPAEFVRRYSESFAQKAQEMGLADLVKMRGEGIRPQLMEMPPTPYQSVAVQRRRLVGKSREKAFRLEAKVVFHRVIEPFIHGLPLHAKGQFLQKVQSLPKDKWGGYLERTLDNCPAIRNEVCVMVASGDNPSRSDRASDLFDREMMIVPLAYADAFVSHDRWIRDVLSKRIDLFGRTRARILSSWADIQQWLGETALRQ